jgi:hypothetical protein
MTRISTTHSVHRLGARAGSAAVLVAGTIALASCKDSNIPFYTAPTSVSLTPSGVQNAITGLLGAFRIDMGNVTIVLSAGYARDGAVFTNTEPRTVEYPLGVAVTPTTSGSVWAQEYQNIRQAQQILAAIPNVSPAYANDEVAALTGVVQTMQAYAYMVMAEAHDTLGFAILPASLTSSQQAPAVCMKDAWQYVIALLDSANTQLVSAGATAPPIKLPTGMKGVGATSGPGHVAGSFASFNRALAVKANLEYAYALARSTAGHAPTPTTPGVPDPAAIARALALLDSTAMFNASGILLTPTTPGGFTPNATTVTHDFSGASGDVVNPIQGQIGTEAQLNDFVADVDTVNDLRFKAKFIINPNPVQQQVYNAVANECCVGGKPYSWLYYMSPSPGSSIPIIRSEGLTLIAAQIHLAMGDLAGAVALVNQVRTVVGGLPAGAPTLDYVHVRDFLMKEQRISMTWEASADRTIAIRMYGLAAVADTTWGTVGHPNEDANVNTGDTHTTVYPIPVAEINGRGGAWTTTCN